MKATFEGKTITASKGWESVNGMGRSMASKFYQHIRNSEQGHMALMQYAYRVFDVVTSGFIPFEITFADGSLLTFVDDDDTHGHFHVYYDL